MDKSELRRLYERSRCTVAELAASEPELARALRRAVAEAARERLVAALEDAVPEVRERVAALEIDPLAGLDGLPGVGAVAAAARQALERSVLDRAMVAAAVARLPGPEPGDQPPATTDTVLAEVPAVRRLLERAKVHLVGELAGLGEDQAEAVLAQAPSFAEIDDAVLAALVGQGVLEEGTARSFGLAATLFQLFDEDLALTAAVKHGRSEHLRGRVRGQQVTSVVDLAPLSADDWRAILDDAGVAAPAGSSRPAYAARLADRFAVLCPSDALLGRLPSSRARDTVEHLERVAPLVGRGVSIITSRVGDLDTTAASEDDLDDIRRSQAALVRLANAYPAMGIDALIDDPDLAPEDKARRIAGRVALIARVAERHAGAELLALDYAPGSQQVAALDLAGLGLSLDEQCMVIGCLEAYQRVYVLTDHVDTARAALLAGFDSAVALATLDRAQVMDRLGADMDMDMDMDMDWDEAVIRRIHDRARLSLGTTTHCALAVLALGQGGFAQLGASNLGPDIGASLERLSGYAELAGALSACRCERCQSILGPVAYFVDLMSFVDEHLARGDAGLASRRPDLWTLPLTCRTAYERVATLDIVNDVLERYIARQSGVTGVNGAAEDRTEVERAVYFHCLASPDYCRPFWLPLERLRIYLEHAGVSQEHVARVLGAAPSVVAAAALGLCEREIATLCEPELDLAELRAIYGVRFQAHGGVIEPVEVPRLMRSLDMSRAELDELIATRFVQAVNHAVHIHSDTAPRHRARGPLERVHELTVDTLDRMHRLARLGSALPWSIGELDLVLDQLGHDDLSPAAIDDIVTVRELEERLAAPIEDLCALWGNAPRTAARPDRPSLFDRVFNTPVFARKSGALPQRHTAFIHPAFRTSEPDEHADAMHARLLAGLRLDDEALHRLILHLAAPLGVALDSADEADRGIALTACNLSLLYRHACLARTLGLSIPALFQLIELTEGMARDHVATLSDLVAVIHHHDWWRDSGFALDDVAFITGAPVRDPGRYAALDIPDERARELASLLGRDLEAPDQPEAERAAAIAPLAVVFADPVFDLPALAFIRDHRSLFGIASFASLSVHEVKALVLYRRFARCAAPHTGASPAGDIADLHAALLAFDPVSGFTPAANQPLARLLRASPGLVSTLRGHLALPATAPGALDVMARAVELAQRLGVSGDTLIHVAAQDYASLSHAADVIYGALCAGYTDDAERRRALQPCEDALRARKRDALVDYVTHALRPDLTQRSDLADHFLVDVDAAGSARTSRVMAAIASVQRYVHRCLTGLEPGAPDIPRAAWTWRASYDVWQASRGVFLYPENHLEPGGHDDRTPLFDQLDAALTRSCHHGAVARAASDRDLDDRCALDAYAAYIDGFEELAGLSVAGAYHELRPGSGTGADVLYLVGVRAGDPPVHFYRTVDYAVHGELQVQRGPVWSPWRRIDVPIPARRVAPVIHRDRLYVFWVERRAPGDMRLGFTSLRLDGTWSAPQHIALPASPQDETDPLRDPFFVDPDDPDTAPLLSLASQSLSLYAGVDPARRQVHPRDGLRAAPPPRPEQPLLCVRDHTLYYGFPAHWYSSRNAFANLVIEQERIQRFTREHTPELIGAGLYRRPIARLGEHHDILAVPGSIEDAVLQVGGDTLLLQGSVRPGARYLLRRVGTTAAEDVARALVTGGVDRLIDLQRSLGEAGLPITRVGTRIEDATSPGALDLSGPYGAYYREIFFHIPLVIADRLRRQQRFAAARRWYGHIFDPTAAEPVDLPPGLRPAERDRRLRDRMWRYLEHRGLDAHKLRRVLTDPAAIEAHRAHPFEPHAIARLRPGAYQTHVVMRYIDTLLAWADSLLVPSGDQAHHDAAMLYRRAADILGPRPPERGPCREDDSDGEPLTYARLQPAMGRRTSAVLLLTELESWTIGAHRKLRGMEKKLKTRFMVDQAMVSAALDHAHGRAQRDLDHTAQARYLDVMPGFGWSMLRQLGAGFCLPPNRELMAYWDRIDERLRDLRRSRASDDTEEP